ncbi:hypothetical protein [Paraburkholderia sp. J11-2]|uniref:hypothetical protein n=1 Tax=Paraburkholderia sp. J11-2 TaxID=2805431 RepID=UPI002AB6F24B|nr:hypothetical protein [Paraburkholderia sp. J11-2]
MPEVSQREFARMMGVTHRAVQKAIAAKRISVTASGKVNPETARMEWQRNTDEGRKSFEDLSRQAQHAVQVGSQGSNAARSAVEAMPALLDERDAETDVGDADEALPAASGSDPLMQQYRAARAAREQTRHAREQLELEQLRGNLIDVEVAQRLAFTALRTVRDAVMNVAVRVKDELAAETDEGRIQRRLEDELAAALNAIDSKRILREIEADESDGSD